MPIEVTRRVASSEVCEQENHVALIQAGQERPPGVRAEASCSACGVELHLEGNGAATSLVRGSAADLEATLRRYPSLEV